MKTKPAIATLLLALTLSAAAFADADDEVTLKNGGSVRGTVVSVEPGSRVVVLEVGAKEPRALPWAEVADVQKGKFATHGSEPGPTKAGYADAPADEPAAGKPGVVKIHIDADRPVQLLEEMSTSVGAVGGYLVTASQVRSVCAAPCDRVVDASRGQQFAVVGDDMPPSDAFRLSDRAGDATIKVDSGSSGLRTGGGVLATFGILGLTAGIPMIVIGAAVDGKTADTLTAAGAVATGAGAAFLAGGIAMLIVGKTKIEVTNGEPQRTGAAATKATARAPRYWAGEF